MTFDSDYLDRVDWEYDTMRDRRLDLAADERERRARSQDLAHVAAQAVADEVYAALIEAHPAAASQAYAATYQAVMRRLDTGG
jgi:hypothetical protein